MNQNDMDEEFIMGEGTTPKIEACLLHPTEVSVKTYSSQHCTAYAGVLYGLCDDCVELLNIDDLYQWVIDAEIKKRLNSLSKD